MLLNIFVTRGLRRIGTWAGLVLIAPCFWGCCVGQRRAKLFRRVDQLLNRLRDFDAVQTHSDSEVVDQVFLAYVLQERAIDREVTYPECINYGP